MKSKMIVSSNALREALEYVERTRADQDDYMVTFVNDGGSVEVSGVYVSRTTRDWEDFEIDREKAKKLHRLLLAMSEQPITVTYDGNWFTIQEVLV